MATYNPGQDVAFEERTILQQSFVVQVKGVNAVQNNAQAWRRIRGAVTLEEACIRLALTQVHNLTPRALRTVPWRVAQKIWRRIHPMSFETWRMFVQVFGHEENHPDALIVLRGGTFSLPPGMENGTAWLTILNLQVNFASFEDLVNLSSITSLAVLILNGEPSMLENSNRTVDDRLIRTWSRSSQEAGAFSNLRIVSFHRCRYLTMQCLESLSKIGELAWSFFHNCHGMSSLDNQSQELVATVRKEWSVIDLQDLKELDCQDRTILGLRKLPDLEHYAWLDWYKEETRHPTGSKSLSSQQPCSQDTNQSSKPMLSFFCGRQPLALDYPLVFRKRESENSAVHDPSHMIQLKRPSDHQVTRTNSKRRMRDGKIQNADFSQFY